MKGASDVFAHVQAEPRSEERRGKPAFLDSGKRDPRNDRKLASINP